MLEAKSSNLIFYTTCCRWNCPTHLDTFSWNIAQVNKIAYNIPLISSNECKGATNFVWSIPFNCHGKTFFSKNFSPPIFLDVAHIFFTSVFSMTIVWQSNIWRAKNRLMCSSSEVNNFFCGRLNVHYKHTQKK